MDEQEVADYLNRNRDYGECIPGCPICEGTGWIAAHRQTDSIHDPNFGKLAMCPNKRNQTWDLTLGLDEAEAAYLNLDTLIPTKQLIAARPYLQHLLVTNKGWLWIEGAPGVGKTTLLKAAVLQCRYRYAGTAKYMVQTELMDHIRQSFEGKNKGEQYELRMDLYKQVPFLCLDEMGRDLDTEFATKTLGKILDHRYNQALTGKQVTIFASNLSPNEVFEKYMADRVKDSRFQMIKLEGPSARATIKTQDPTPGWWRGSIVT